MGGRHDVLTVVYWGSRRRVRLGSFNSGNMTRFNDPPGDMDPLLVRAIEVLTTTANIFDIKPWKEIMKHKSEVVGGVLVSKTQRVITHAQLIGEVPLSEGLDSTPTDMVYSESDQSDHPPVKDSEMTEVTTERQVSPEQQAKEEAVKAKIAAKEAKIKEAADRKAQAEAERLAKAEQRAKDVAEARAKKSVEEQERVEQLKAESEEKGEKRTYFGPMIHLAERAKNGHYVKSALGQLRSDDDLARALDSVRPANVVKLAMVLLNDTTNRYEHLNIGQQSMNYRNKMRGAIKAGTFTIDDVKRVRDEEGLTEEVEPKKERVKAEAGVLPAEGTVQTGEAQT